MLIALTSFETTKMAKRAGRSSEEAQAGEIWSKEVQLCLEKVQYPCLRLAEVILIFKLLFCPIKLFEDAV